METCDVFFFFFFLFRISSAYVTYSTVRVTNGETWSCADLPGVTSTHLSNCRPRRHRNTFVEVLGMVSGTLGLNGPFHDDGIIPTWWQQRDGAVTDDLHVMTDTMI